MNSNCSPDLFGASPANIKWNVVRGDTATINVEFYQPDETTAYDTTGWTYLATAYNAKTDTYYTLDIEDLGASVKITATPLITQDWGTGIGPQVAELKFDLQVTTLDDTVWTPVIGTISVTGDVTGASDVVS
jgi:hypothetical protein